MSDLSNSTAVQIISDGHCINVPRGLNHSSGQESNQGVVSDLYAHKTVLFDIKTNNEHYYTAAHSAVLETAQAVKISTPEAEDSNYQNTELIDDSQIFSDEKYIDEKPAKLKRVSRVYQQMDAIHPIARIFHMEQQGIIRNVKFSMQYGNGVRLCNLSWRQKEGNDWVETFTEGCGMNAKTAKKEAAKHFFLDFFYNRLA